ncbi:MAG: cytochrome bd-I oxidase subunit CydX [Rhodospirillum sp.]|nr:cytochrome bd-I oxidase subunit CydX [Rhodospirillum sp.]MCF8490688.1 cytochrome bd-I oxidase subunit CydX [Rhodospirillum sp.]MCF8502339.1 cytochrome bd-I oxidase subunit CydX [Rhodospirillum sp.]
MWYFTWILGLTAALSFGVINAMWYEAEYAFNGVSKGEAGSEPTRRS